MQEVIVGIDVSKNKVDVAFLIGDQITLKEYPNQEKGYLAMMSWIQKNGLFVSSVCMEATGAYSEKIAEYFYDAGFFVSVVNPLQIKRFAQSLLARTKTDRADARNIAYFAQKMKLTRWHPLSPEKKALRSQVRRLDSLKGLLLQENNRIQEEKDPTVTAATHRLIAFLKNETKLLKKNIDAQIKQSQQLKNASALLETIPGVGAETARQIIAHIDVERFEHSKQLSAFVGLNPRQHQSGSSVRGKTRISKMGDGKLRRTFYMPAVVAIKYNPVIADFYETLVRRGKPKMVAICAAMRKLLHIVYGVLKSGMPFSMELARRHLPEEKLA